MDSQARDRQDQEPEAIRKPFVGGMPVWDRFTGEGPWVLEQPVGAFFAAAIKHPDGGRELQRAFVERAWVVQTPGGAEIVPETRLTHVPPKRQSDAKALVQAVAIFFAAAACTAPFLAMVFRCL